MVGKTLKSLNKNWNANKVNLQCLCFCWRYVCLSMGWSVQEEQQNIKAIRHANLFLSVTALPQCVTSVNTSFYGTHQCKHVTYAWHTSRHYTAHMSHILLSRLTCYLVTLVMRLTCSFVMIYYWVLRMSITPYLHGGWV